MDSARILASAADFLPTLDKVVASHFNWFSPRDLTVLLVAVLLYHCVPNKTWQNVLLLLLGAWLVWWMSPVLLVVAVSLGIVEWTLARGIARSEDERRRARLSNAAAAINLAVGAAALLLCTESVWRILSGHLAVWTGGGSAVLPGWLATALGGLKGNLYFFVFGLTSVSTLCLDTRNGKLEGRPGFLESMTFQSLFFRFAGIRARDTVPQLRSARRWDSVRLGEVFWLGMDGILKIAIYKWILQTYSLMEGPGTSGAAVLLGAPIQVLGIWTLFSGQIDLSRAVAFLFGIHLPPNFDAPFESRNFAEFWRRWNIVLGAWLNEEIYAKIGFALRNWGDLGVLVACLVTFVFCGLIHGLMPSNLSWGFLMGVGMAVYLLSRKTIRKWAKQRGNPRWLDIASVVLTLSFFAAASFPMLHNSVSWVGVALRSVWTGPFWPQACDQIRWGPFAGAVCVALVLHSLPRRLGRVDAWQLSLGTGARILAGIAMVAAMFVAVSLT